MKNIILALIAVLVVIFVGLSFLGTGGEYAAEKLLYSAIKANSKIAANPDVVPPALIKSVENNLNKLVTDYPEAKIAKAGNMALAEFYLTRKDYAKTISITDAVLEKYKDDDVTASKAQFLKSVAYEKEGNWDRAVVEFKVLQDKYPLTQLGIQVPLYVANYYDVKGDKEKAKEAYARARSFYEKTEQEYSGKNLGLVVSLLLVQTSLNSKDYEMAGRSIESTLEKYPSAITYRQLLPYVDLVFIEKLSQPQRAIAIYKNLEEKSADERMKKALQTKISSIEEKK